MTSSSAGRWRAGPVLKALGLLLAAGHAPSGLAQVELPLPSGREATPAAASTPPAVRVVRGARAWVLEATEPPQGGAAAPADSARQRQSMREDRFRTVSTTVGAWMIEDAQATMPAATSKAAAVRTVDIRTAEEFARAMASPQPMVVYRIVN